MNGNGEVVTAATYLAFTSCTFMQAEFEVKCMFREDDQVGSMSSLRLFHWGPQVDPNASGRSETYICAFCATWGFMGMPRKNKFAVDH